MSNPTVLHACNYISMPNPDDSLANLCQQKKDPGQPMFIIVWKYYIYIKKPVHLQVMIVPTDHQVSSRTKDGGY